MNTHATTQPIRFAIYVTHQLPYSKSATQPVKWNFVSGDYESRAVAEQSLIKQIAILRRCILESDPSAWSKADYSKPETLFEDFDAVENVWRIYDADNIENSHFRLIYDIREFVG